MRLGDYNIRAQAGAVDTYVRPDKTPPEESALMGLLKAVSSEEKKIKGFLTQYQATQIEEDTKAAREARLRNQHSYAEAVKLHRETNGEQGIPAGMSPWWIKEYKRTDGMLRARNEYMQWLSEEYHNTGMAERDYDTPVHAAAAYGQFVDEARNRYLDSLGDSVEPDWFEGFESERGNIEQSLSTMNLNMRTQANEEKFNESVAQYVNTVLDSNAGDADKIAAIWEDKEAKIGKFGMSGRIYNQIVVDSVTDRAVNLAKDGRYLQAEDTLNLLNGIKSGSGYVGGTAYANGKMQDSLIKIHNLQRSNEEKDRADQRWREHQHDRPYQVNAMEHAQWARENAVKAHNDEEYRIMKLSEALTTIMATPKADHDTILRELAADPRTAQLSVQMTGFSQQWNGYSETVDMDPLFVYDLTVGAMEGTVDSSHIRDALLNKKIDGKTADKLLTEFRETMDSNNGLTNVNNRQRSIINEAASDVEQLVASIYHHRGLESKASSLSAKREVVRVSLEHLQNNPNTGELELRDFIEGLTTRIANRVNSIENPEDTKPAYIPSTGLQLPTPTQNATTLTNQPTETDLKYLQKNPKKYTKTFEKKFGAGSAQQYLGGLNE